MEVGDRVTVIAGSDVLNDGELVGWDAAKARVWLPGKGSTRSYDLNQLAILTSRFTPRPPRTYRRERDTERVRQQRIAGR